MDGFIEILKIILPAVAVFFAAFLIVKRFLENEDKRREHDLNKGNQSITSPLRLQAYERIIIFLERINPSSLLVRVNKNGMNCHQFHMELIKTIKSEFEHNLSQQIYMKICPSSIWCWNSNPRPSEHEYPPITTRSGYLK